MSLALWLVLGLGKCFMIMCINLGYSLKNIELRIGLVPFSVK